MTEHSIFVDSYGEGSLGGEPVSFNAEDQVVAAQNECYEMPGEPGWYQINARINGTGYNDEYIDSADQGEIFSHYFYICECGSEEEAREQLGPPPSEPTPTPTASPTPPSEPTPTPEPTPTRTPPTEGTPFPSSTPTATPASSPEPIATTSATTSGTAVADDAQGANAGRDGSGSGGGVTTPTDSPTPTQPGNWSAVVEQSPTVAEGPGLGIGAATMGLLLTGLLVRRRR